MDEMLNDYKGRVRGSGGGEVLEDLGGLSVGPVMAVRREWRDRRVCQVGLRTAEKWRESVQDKAHQVDIGPLDRLGAEKVVCRELNLARSDRRRVLLLPDLQMRETS